MKTIRGNGSKFQKKIIPGVGYLKFDIPHRGSLNITNKCNLRCVHCYVHASTYGNKSKAEMTTAEIISVLDQLADMGVLYLLISGGEPFIRSDFWKILEHAKKRDFAIIINTNGSLITKDSAQRLADLFIYKLNVSIYGMSERVYKSVTGTAGVFKKVMHGIEALVEKGVIVDLTIIILRENFHQIKKFKEFEKKTNLTCKFGCSLHPCLDKCQAPLEHIVTETQLEKLVHILPEACKPVIDFIPGSSGMLCFEARNRIAINPYGEVSICQKIPNNTNIRERPIAEIYKKDPLMKRTRKILWRDVPKCLNCEALFYCKPCPADFFLYTGKLATSSSDKLCKGAWMRKRVWEKLKK